MSLRFGGRRRIRLRFEYPLGDQVVFAGALRELHRCYPNEFDIELECSLTQFWEGCPYARAFAPASKPLVAVPPGGARDRYIPSAGEFCQVGGGQEVLNDRQWIDVDGRFFTEVNQRPRHMLQAYVEFLNAQLGTHVDVERLAGEVFMTPAEQESPGPVEALLGRRVPYWVVCNGGKFDRTVKWWPDEFYQEVVDAYQNRLLFVQVGRSCDYHPKIRGALDFRGWSDIRTLLRLVYWSEGVVCPITSLMHLAAAVPRSDARDGLRPCVVLGGGIEPPHWTAYPGHRFLSTVDIVDCSGGGCWKARTLSLGDGAPQDAPDQRCVSVDQFHARCMRLIRVPEVVDAVESFVKAGNTGWLSERDVTTIHGSLRVLGGSALSSHVVTRATARLAIERHAHLSRRARFRGSGRGIATLVCGLDYVASGWVLVRLLRQLGCRLPIEVWVMEGRHWLETLRRVFEPYQVEVRELLFEVDSALPRSSLFAAKPEVLVRSRFEEVMWLDADNFPVVDPSYLFDDPTYQRFGAAFWPEPAGYRSTLPEAWAMFGLEPESESESSEVQGGEMLMNKRLVSAPLHLIRWCNRRYRLIYSVFNGDKDIFRLAFRKLGYGYAMPEGRAELRDACLFQGDFQGHVIFQHRVGSKLRVGRRLDPVAGFVHESTCAEFLREFTDRIAANLGPLPPVVSRAVCVTPIDVQWG